MRQCAFLTLDERGDFVIDDEHAVEPLERLGWRVSTLSWRQSSVPWSEFDAVVIRSTWDYWDDVPAFLETLKRIDRATRLENPLSLVHWNLAKTYLQDLHGQGVPIVPTLFRERLCEGDLAACARELGSDDLVVKPVIGANGQDAFRLAPGDDPVRLADIAGRFRGRGCLVQRFMPAILSEGEYSLFYFSGALSHAILKVPAQGEFRSQEEHGSQILPVAPEPELREAADRAMAVVSPTPLYGRIDFVRDETGGFVVMELELIEPSMYLRTDPGAPERFARAVDSWFSEDSQ